MGLRTRGGNISVSCLAIRAAAVFETSCGKKNKQTNVAENPTRATALAWVTGCNVATRVGTFELETSNFVDTLIVARASPQMTNIY